MGVDNSPDYAIKERTRVCGPWEAGKKPIARNEKAGWDEIRQHAVEGNLESVPSDVYVRYFNNLQRIHSANLP